MLHVPTIILFILIVLLLLTVLAVTNLVLKAMRFLIDRQQYGRPDTTVRLNYGAHTDEFEKQLDQDQRIEWYRRTLEETGRYASWPAVQNFNDQWRKQTQTQSILPKKSIWYTISKLTQNDTNSEQNRIDTRKVLFFIHGGATFSGSPHKYNNLHWLQTVGWLGGLDNRYTDLISIDYALRPEYTCNQSLHDCIQAIDSILDYYQKHGTPVSVVHLIGFSAGGTLALQCAVLLAHKLQQRTTREKTSDDSRLFKIDQNTETCLNRLCNPRSGTWRNLTTKQLYLLAPLVRLDRLFINEQYDVSRMLKYFAKVFYDTDNERMTFDTLFTINRYNVQLNTSFDRVCIIDACRNSLSNHAISLYDVLKREKNLRLQIILFNETDLLIDKNMAQKIYMYETRQGKRPHKYVRHVAESLKHTKNTNHNNYNDNTTANLTHFIHYHFFMYILPCNASWITLHLILCDREDTKEVNR